MVKAYVYLIATSLLVDKASSIPSIYTRSIFAQVKEEPFPNPSNSSTRTGGVVLPRLSAMSEDNNDSEITPLLSAKSLYSLETQENSTSGGFEDVENDRLKKWELIAWDDYKNWFKVAERKKNEVIKARQWKLRLAVAGAILQTVSSQIPAVLQVTRFGSLLHKVPEASTAWWVNIEIPSRRILSTAGAICLSALPILEKTVLSKDNIAARIESRIVSEMLDSEIQKSLARVGPYRNRDRDATENFIEKILQIEELSTKINPEQALSIEEGIGRISGSPSRMLVSRWRLPGIFRSEKKVDARKLPEISKNCRDYKERYIKLRLESMIEKRLKSAKRLEGLSNYYKGWESGFQIGAVLLGIINGSNGSNAGVWITALLAASGALSTHIHANQIDKQAGDLYVLVIIPLKRRMRMREKVLIKNEAELPDEWDSFVEDCEHILLSQTLQWSSIVSKTAENKEGSAP